nr:MAG TPA: Endonuclease [Caudoviricetes sp.]
MRQYWNSGRRKANKYGARPKTVDGIRFDSTLEADYYVYLKALKRSGVISKL